MTRCGVLEVLVLALALAADATAAAAVRGMVAPTVRVRDATLIAALAGGFQGGMAGLGWLAGDRLGSLFSTVDHWIAFGLLLVIGGKTAWEGLRSGDDDGVDAGQAFALGPLVVVALATSIDAAAAGVTLPLFGQPAPAMLAVITGVTAALVAAGVYAGRALGAWLGRGLDVVGGLILIGLGVKILFDHHAF